jgi:hypothetical protein
MFFHKSGVMYFKKEVDDIVSGWPKTLDVARLDKLLNKLKKHQDDIDAHMKLGDNVMDSLKNSLLHDYFQPIRVDMTQEIPADVHRDESFIRQQTERLKSVYLSLSAMIKNALKHLSQIRELGQPVPGEALMTGMLDDLRGINGAFSEIHLFSKDLASTIKDILSKLDAAHHLRKKYLDKEGSSLNDFHRNILSWIHDEPYA